MLQSDPAEAVHVMCSDIVHTRDYMGGGGAGPGGPGHQPAVVSLRPDTSDRCSCSCSAREAGGATAATNIRKFILYSAKLLFFVSIFYFDSFFVITNFIRTFQIRVRPY